jgi:transcription initiation factor TFIIB
MSQLQNCLFNFEKNNLCNICYIAEIDIKLPNCNHSICCSLCIDNIKECSICNTPNNELNNNVTNKNATDNNESENINKLTDVIDVKCINCFNTDLYNDFEKGYLVCTNCGLINSNKLDTSAEWRFYNSEDSKTSDPSRCGCPTNPYLPKSSLGTMIASSNQNLTRIHQWNSMPYNERSLLHVFNDIKSICSKNNIPKSIVDDAIFYYKKIHDSKVITRGAIRKGIKASCVLIACQKQKLSMVPADIAKMFDIKSTDLTRGCKKFYELIGTSEAVTDVENLTSFDYINRYCKKIKLSKKYTEIAKEVAKNADKIQTIRENTPPSVAAGSILLICTHFNLVICKKDISKGCGISEVTITKTYRKLLPVINELIPSDDFVNKLNIKTNFEDISKVKLYDIYKN